MASAKSLLQEEIGLIRHGVQRLCSRYGSSYWRELDAKKQYPTKFVQEMIESGFLNVMIPDRYGGAGLGLVAASAVLEEIHRSGGSASACHAQMYMCASVLKHGTAEQVERWLPQIVSGQVSFQAFGVTEPDAGSNTLNIQTRAELSPCGSEYVLNGQKLWTSRAAYSDWMLVLARNKSASSSSRLTLRQDESPSGNAVDRTRGLGLFVITDLKEQVQRGNITIRPIDTMINHHTTQVFLHDVKIPRRNVLGPETEGFRCLLDSLNVERVLIASECIGDAKFFLDKASSYAKQRKVFDTVIGAHQGIAFPMARCYAQMRAADCMVQQAAQRYDQQQKCGTESNVAKLLASEASWEAANMCVQTYGGFAFATEFDIERKFRETRLYQVAPISTNMILSHLATHELGLPKSYLS